MRNVDKCSGLHRAFAGNLDVRTEYICLFLSDASLHPEDATFNDMR